MALEREFQTARKNGYQGTRTQFFKLQAINKAEWLDVYLTSLSIATNFEDDKKRQEISKILNNLNKLMKEIQELEV
jgi:galactitol-specific phosphotransferase system IIB component